MEDCIPAAPCAEVSQRSQNHRLLHRKHDELGWMDLLASGGAESTASKTCPRKENISTPAERDTMQA